MQIIKAIQAYLYSHEYTGTKHMLNLNKSGRRNSRDSICHVPFSMFNGQKYFARF